MKNSKCSVSKQGNNQKEKKQKQKNSPRSPLQVKDLNAATSSEAPRGCLSFFLSNHHTCSIVSENACNQSKSVASKTPKTVKTTREKLGDAYVENPERPTSKIVNKLRRKCEFGSRSDLSDEISSGSDPKSSDTGNGLGLDCCVGYDEGLKLDDDDNTSPVPPVQASVSPEIQGGLGTAVPATPNACYSAGYVLSGVSDRRKCKPRGILTIGKNDLFGSCKTKVLNNVDESVSVSVGLSNRKNSLVPCPTDASVDWILSPCDEDKSEGREEDDGSGLRLNGFESSGCLSSPCSSLGFSSDILNKSGSGVTTSDSTLASRSSSKSRSRGLFAPSFNHFVCSPTPSSSPVSTSWKLGISSEDRNHLCGQARECTPFSEDYLESGNVIRTPQSNSSSPRFGLPCMSRDEISRLWFDYELDSVAEVLRRVSLSPDSQNPTAEDSPKTSFEFNPLIKPASSFDFSLFKKAIDTQISTEIPDSLSPESEARISWRDGLASYLFEMDELDCCRCFSDDEVNANDCINGSDPNRNATICENGEGNITSSASDVVGNLHALENYDWKVCYKNKLFQG